MARLVLSKGDRHELLLQPLLADKARAPNSWNQLYVKNDVDDVPW